MNISFNRIILYAQDVDKLKRFYQQYFGFTLVEEIENGWVVLKAGEIEIAFHRIGVAYRTTGDKPFKVESNAKMVFLVDADLVVFREQLLAQGLALKPIKTFEGFNALFCDGEDPEGNVFQLQQNLG